jgi:hypothetical protein
MKKFYFERLESLETRALMSVSASLVGNLLKVTGTGPAETISVGVSNLKTFNGNAELRGGTTSVYLNLPLLESAAGLTLTGASTTGRPASSAFQVGFPILPTTNFVYTPGSFAPVGGEIQHSGTITFNNAITVGDFVIGYDPSRATNGRSGFYVEDTASGLGILFDIGAPSSASATDNGLNIGGAPLLVSPEFAQTLLTLGLAQSNLTGARVGTAEINGFSTPAVGQNIVVSGRGMAPVSFPASEVTNVEVDLGRGASNLSITQLDLQGSLTINAGAGFDKLSVRSTAADSLTVNGTKATALSLGVVYSTFVDTNVTGTAGRFSTTSVAVSTDLFSGTVNFDGGPGFDTFVGTGTPIPASSVVGFDFAVIDGRLMRRHR